MAVKSSLVVVIKGKVSRVKAEITDRGIDYQTHRLTAFTSNNTFISEAVFHDRGYGNGYIEGYGLDMDFEFEVSILWQRLKSQE